MPTSREATNFTAGKSPTEALTGMFHRKQEHVVRTAATDESEIKHHRLRRTSGKLHREQEPPDPKTTITIDKNKSSLVKEIQLHAFNQKRLIAEWIERPKAKNYNDKSEINPVETTGEEGGSPESKAARHLREDRRDRRSREPATSCIESHHVPES